MHSSARLFVERMAARHPAHFKNVRVLEIGSQIVNGSVRNLFVDCKYLGIDVAAGPGVDLVCTTGDLMRTTKREYDTIVSTECLEHDALWQETLTAAALLLKSGGLMLMTMANPERPEHGTRRSMPGDCPGLPWPEYYQGLTEQDIRSVLDMDATFAEYGFETGGYGQDLYVYGLKR